MDLRNPKNRQTIIKSFANEFSKIAKKKNNRISLIDIWDTEAVIEKKFGLTMKQSGKMSYQVLNMYAKREELA